MAQHGRALVRLSQHRVIKAELLSGMECAPLGKDEASRAHGDVGGWWGGGRLNIHSERPRCSERRDGAQTRQLGAEAKHLL